MNLETRIKIESHIARTIVKTAIALGYSVTIDNGGGWNGEYEVERETNPRKACKALGATDEEKIFFHKGPHKAGVVLLVYGNDGFDVIADHSLSYEVNEILTPALSLAEKYEKVYA
jgi:hypothetical protein